MFISLFNHANPNRFAQNLIASLVLTTGLLVPAYGSSLQAIASPSSQLQNTVSVPQSMSQKNSYFQESSMDQAVVAVALPRANGRYSLNIYYQISNERACWSEQATVPARIEAHMLDFDFTGICGRSTDSNGYSLRINGQELGMNYRLQLTTTETEILLQAIPEFPGDPIHTIGSSRGLIPGEIMKIYLDPGWQMTQRVYDGQRLGHIYFSTSITEQPALVGSDETPSDMVPSITQTPTIDE